MTKKDILYHINPVRKAKIKEILSSLYPNKKVIVKKDGTIIIKSKAKLLFIPVWVTVKETTLEELIVSEIPDSLSMIRQSNLEYSKTISQDVDSILATNKCNVIDHLYDTFIFAKLNSKVPQESENPNSILHKTVTTIKTVLSEQEYAPRINRMVNEAMYLLNDVDKPNGTKSLSLDKLYDLSRTQFNKIKENSKSILKK